MKFYNRTNEIERLRLALGHSSPQFLVIYGRRRCGKSTLLRHIMAADDVYYMATQSDASVQRSLIARQISEQFPGFNRSVYPDWLQLFEALRERADRRFTLIIDEFPYLAKSDSSLPSTLQLLLEDRDKLGFDLIICSSSQQMMQHYAIKASSPLYGRADEIIKVSPLQAGWLSEHLSDHSDEEIIKEYATWGGVPRYWELRARYSNYIEAVQKLIMDPIGILHEEPNRLLLDDIRDPGFSISLLASIAQGANKLSEIGGRLNRPATDLNRPLNRLIGLGYLKRDRPFGAKAKDKKRNLYKVSDPFMRFYFRYIFPAASDFELNIYDNTIRKI
ncbi:MAG: ATP-binding protein [Bacteroidota bacterium]